MSPSRFLAKIPNVRVLRDFLVNTGGYYCPPLKDMTNSFCRVIPEIKFNFHRKFCLVKKSY